LRMANTQMTDDPRGSNQRPAIRNPQSVLAVHPGALGDVILFGRLLSMLPGPITLVTGREKGELLAGVGVVRKVLDFDALPMHEAFTDTPLSQCRLPKLLGRHRRLISCFAWPRCAGRATPCSFPSAPRRDSRDTCLTCGRTCCESPLPHVEVRAEPLAA